MAKKVNRKQRRRQMTDSGSATGVDGGALFDQALEHQRAGRLDRAEVFYQRVDATSPDYPMARNNLALIQNGQGRTGEALANWRRVVEVDPEFYQAWINCGSLLHALNRPEEAEAAIRRGLALRPDLPIAHYNLGNILHTRNRLEAALEAYERALTLKGDAAKTGTNMGLVLIDLGRLPEAEARLRQAIEIQPDSPVALYNLAGFIKGGSDLQRWIDSTEALLRVAERPVSQRILLHFALGKLLDTAGLYDRAFRHYQHGNRMKKRTCRFDRQAHERLVDRIIALFSRSFIADRAKMGHADQRPVFIVGMPRSGTSLVEQIIASHPRVFGADELSTIGELAVSIPGRLGLDAVFPESVGALDEKTIAELSAAYLDHLTGLAGDSFERISDKMPDNFLRLGLIAILFPRARIIHCRRDFMDTGLSIFFQNFTRPGTNPHAYDLVDIRSYYRDYERLMAHWRRALPLKMLEIDYETIVDDKAGMARQLIDFLELPWDDRCLDFHETKRTVRTASNLQVRQSIYRSSVQRWKRYEKHLKVWQVEDNRT